MKNTENWGQITDYSIQSGMCRIIFHAQSIYSSKSLLIIIWVILKYFNK